MPKEIVTEICNLLTVVDLINISRTCKQLIKICRSLIEESLKNLEFEIAIIKDVKISDFVYLSDQGRNDIFEISYECGFYLFTRFGNAHLPYKHKGFPEMKKGVVNREVCNISRCLSILNEFKQQGIEQISNEEAYQMMDENH